MSQLSEILKKVPIDAKIQLREVAIDLGVSLCDSISRRIKYVDTGEHKGDINLIVEGLCLQGKLILNGWRKFQEPSNP